MPHQRYDPSKPRPKPNNPYIPVKITCPGCGGQISLHMLGRHEGSKSCQSMAKWRRENPERVKAMEKPEPYLPYLQHLG